MILDQLYEKIQSRILRKKYNVTEILEDSSQNHDKENHEQKATQDRNDSPAITNIDTEKKIVLIQIVLS